MSDSRSRRGVRESAGGADATEASAVATPVASAALEAVTQAAAAPGFQPEPVATAAELAPEPEPEPPVASEPAAAVAVAAAVAAPSVPAADEGWAALAESQAAIARGFEALGVEMTGIARSSFTAAADAATALLGAGTFAEAIAINSGYLRRSMDMMIDGSAKLSEVGIKTVTEASRPWMAQLNETWGGRHHLS